MHFSFVCTGSDTEYTITIYFHITDSLRVAICRWNLHLLQQANEREQERDHSAWCSPLSTN